MNGNLSYDLNKAISGIQYNHLNLPTVISVAGKGSISYTYDAAGSKLRKVSVDNTSPGKVITTTTSYFGSLVFESRQTVPSDPGDYMDKLQFAAHEEGRIRWVAAAGAIPAKLVYDYFLKDHLGNVRMVLTEEQQTDSYPAATMESATAGTEEAFYTNLSTTRVDRPSGFPSATGQAKVARVTAAAMGSKVGPAILLKVMSGDKFNVMVHSWWNSAASPGSAVSPLNDLVMALASGIAPLSGGKAVATDLLSPGVLSPNISEFLSTQPIGGGSPKAYLNWILLDEQFKYVSQGSGFDQVGGSNQLKTHSFTNMPISQNGYLYIYVSNETDNIDVFFDNLQVTHIRGPLLEETHYYPFGLTMQGISSMALNGAAENKKEKFQGQPFDDDFGINYYNFKWRNHDPQIGRFIEIDPLSEEYEYNSTYAFSENKVTNHIELEGLEAIPVSKDLWQQAQALPPQARVIAGIAIALVAFGELIYENPEALSGGGMSQSYPATFDLYIKSGEPKAKVSKTEPQSPAKQRSASDQKLINEAKQQKAKDDASKTRSQQRQKQSADGKAKEGTSNQGTRGSHNSGNQSSSDKEKHDRAEARRAKEQAAADKKKEETKKN